MLAPSELPHAPACVDGQRRETYRAITDRRVAVRTVCTISALTREVGTAEIFARWAVIKDTSPHGLGFLGARLYDVDTVLLVWADARDAEPPILARVVYNRPEPTGWFHGCQYVEVDPSN